MLEPSKYVIQYFEEIEHNKTIHFERTGKIPRAGCSDNSVVVFK